MKKIIFIFLFYGVIRAQDDKQIMQAITKKEEEIKKLVYSVPGAKRLIDQIKNLLQRRKQLSPELVKLDAQYIKLQNDLCSKRLKNSKIQKLEQEAKSIRAQVAQIDTDTQSKLRLIDQRAGDIDKQIAELSGNSKQNTKKLEKLNIERSELQNKISQAIDEQRATSKPLREEFFKIQQQVDDLLAIDHSLLSKLQDSYVTYYQKPDLKENYEEIFSLEVKLNGLVNPKIGQKVYPIQREINILKEKLSCPISNHIGTEGALYEIIYEVTSF